MAISLEEVRHVATLARLELNEAEILQFRETLNAILGHFTDLDGVLLPQKWMEEALAPRNSLGTDPLADDVPGPVLTRSAALANAPKSKAGLFLVSMIHEE
ncbi:MAG: Asp-tRNA(Asn)/Glu-tRNA(Gln) amidotransferase GatCAB subunit C [Armatimonadota bacterium]